MVVLASSLMSRELPSSSPLLRASQKGEAVLETRVEARWYDKRPLCLSWLLWFW